MISSSTAKFIIVIGVILLPFFIYLVWKAADERGWDDWGFGSAQTMLTARFWGRDGFIQHKFFFIPSGYNPEIEFLDEPEFRFLADGTKAGGLIGNRLYYTHYPSGYLIPYGLLAKFGVENRFFFRFLALLFSFASVLFLAGFLYLIFDRNLWIPAIAAFYYSTSETFLAYADSLSNIPVDDFFKWLILFLSIYGVSKIEAGEPKKWVDKTVWFLFFVLALSSYDSTFFIFFWLCALDYITKRRLNFKKYIFWASAPILAFAMQIAQNAWYLGFKNMLLDFLGAFIFRLSQVMGSANELPLVIKNAVVSLAEVGYLTDMRARFALPLVAIFALLLYRGKFFDSKKWKVTVALFAAGLMLGFLLPGVGVYGYQGRQMAPAFLLVFSYATYEIILRFAKKDISKTAVLLFAAIFVFWAVHAKETVSYVKNWPNGAIAEEKINYWQEIKNITAPNTIVMGTKESLEVGTSEFFEQFYMDRPAFVFNDTGELLDYLTKIGAVVSGGEFLVVAPKNKKDAIIEHARENQFGYALKDGAYGQEDIFYLSVFHK